MLSVLRTYWIEIAALVVIVVGFLVMVLQRSQVVNVLEGLKNIATQTTAAIQGFLTSHFSLTDLIGLGVGILGLAFIFWRIRVRLDNSAARRLNSCPRCGAELHRIHRSWLDRLFTTLFFPHGRRYQCRDPKCAWTGLLHKGVHNRLHETMPPPPAAPISDP